MSERAESVGHDVETPVRKASHYNQCNSALRFILPQLVIRSHIAQRLYRHAYSSKKSYKSNPVQPPKILNNEL